MQVTSLIQSATRTKAKSGAVVKHQRTFVVEKTTSNVNELFKSGRYPSLGTSLSYKRLYIHVYCVNSTLGRLCSITINVQGKFNKYSPQRNQTHGNGMQEAWRAHASMVIYSQ